MSTEPKTPAVSTSTTTAPSRARRLRTRALWTIITLCLLLWSIKAIHYALQPKYQGKTAEEWFEAIQIRKPGQGRNEHTYTMSDPAVAALVKMDADAVPVIVKKYQQEDSALRRWLIHQVEHYSNGKNFWNPKRIEESALTLLCLS